MLYAVDSPTHDRGRPPVARAATTMADLRAVAELFGAVWGRGDEGLPIGSEMLRSLVHADGLVSVLDGDNGSLLGAAVLGRAGAGSAYSYLAATAPGEVERGLGMLLKHHQRQWCLERGIGWMRWTFDPLVGRNARFNLTKLGAVADRYEPEFYGVMSDQINGTDPADRLVARWRLDDPGRRPDDPQEPPEPPADAGGHSGGLARQPGGGVVGPDGHAAYVIAGRERWVRVPTDVVALRRSDPTQASAWRGQVREWFTEALAHGLVATGVTRAGWYHLVPKETR